MTMQSVIAQDKEKLREELLESVRQKFGFVPNVIKEMSVSPAATTVYLKGQEAMQFASLDQKEQMVVQLAISIKNGCGYCTAAHAAMLIGAGFSWEELDQVKVGGNFEEIRLNRLTDLTRKLMQQAGHLSTEEIAAYNTQGISREQIYDVITLIGLKTITNYINHLSHVTLDPQFRGQ